MSRKDCSFFKKVSTCLATVAIYLGYYWCVLVVIALYLAVNFGAILLPTYWGLTNTPHLVGIFTVESLLFTIFACTHRAKNELSFVRNLFTGVPKIDLLNVLSLCTAFLCVIASFDPSSLFFSIFLCIVAVLGFVYLFIENKRHVKKQKKPKPTIN